MNKNLLLIILLFSCLFIYGCDKKTNIDSPVYLSFVDIDAISNKSILDTINDDSLDSGVYQIITQSNKYIYFYGDKIQYSDISSKLEEKNLIITCSTNPNSTKNKKLYVIREKNTTSTGGKSSFYDTLSLEINNKHDNFKNIYILNNDL